MVKSEEKNGGPSRRSEQSLLISVGFFFFSVE